MSKTSRLNKARQEKQEARDKAEGGGSKNGEQRPMPKNGNQGAPEKRGGREG